MSVKKSGAILLTGVLVLSVLLFIAPKVPDNEISSVKGELPANVNTDADLSVFLMMAQKTLDPELKSASDRLEGKKDYDSLSLFWDRLKRPDLSSFYFELAAATEKTSESWLLAGNRYYNAVQFCRDKSEVPVLYFSAIRCFKECLKAESLNNEARIMLASCYVEGTEDPMKGISLLREVEQVDSNNVKLQLAFAFFSIKSGQLDKAIERFKKALRADSSYIEAYLHLADLYEQMGRRSESILMLQKYSELTPDFNEKAEVKKYIEELKTDL